MNRMVERAFGGLLSSCFLLAALALLMTGWEARANGLLSNVSEASGYRLVYEFPVPTNSPG